MKLEYNSIIEESSFILTDFNCNPSKQLLSNKGYYKILWLHTKGEEISVDGYSLSFIASEITTMRSPAMDCYFLAPLPHLLLI